MDRQAHAAFTAHVRRRLLRPRRLRACDYCESTRHARAGRCPWQTLQESQSLDLTTRRALSRLFREAVSRNRMLLDTLASASRAASSAQARRSAFWRESVRYQDSLPDERRSSRRLHLAAARVESLRHQIARLQEDNRYLESIREMYDHLGLSLYAAPQGSEHPAFYPEGHRVEPGDTEESAQAVRSPSPDISEESSGPARRSRGSRLHSPDGILCLDGDCPVCFPQIRHLYFET